MKKLIAMLLCAGLLFSTAGCINEPSTPSTVPTSSSTEAEPSATTQGTLPPEIMDIPLLSFSAPVVTEEYRAGDNTVLFTYTYQNISMILEDPQIADSIVIDLLNQVDYENSAAKNILTDAQAAYTGQKDWVPYSFSTVFSPERLDQNILSLYGIQSVYNGSPRSASARISATYDLLTGRQLELKDVLVNDFSADKLCELITDALSGLADKGTLYSDYAYVVSELFTTNKPTDTWYLSTNGLCFFFAPYEIAPYSSGTVIAEIPYSALTGLLKDAYFPVETIESSGQLLASPFLNADLTQFKQFDELILDKEGTKYLLHTDGCLQNVRIDLGTWLNDGTFLPEATVYAAAALCSTDGIMIQYAMDTTQGLRITYKENNTVVSLDLTAVTANN